MCLRFTSIFYALLVCAPAYGAAADRILSRIDFEERPLGNPEELPMHWAKVEGPLMPHYVNGRLVTDTKRSGEHSFRFDLNGGSAVYRYGPGQIKAQPQAHYRIEVYVRTTVMAHARARLSAYFVDVDKHLVKGSVKHSKLYAAKQADEPWNLLWLEMAADRRADSLVVELELLQPELYVAPQLGSQALFPQDIKGSAWFDDLVISQVPKLALSTERPGNIFRRGQPPSLTVLVSDRATDDLTGQLIVRNAEKKVVYQRSSALDIAGAEAPQAGARRMHLLLPALPPGWYECTLAMCSGGEVVARQSVDLVLLADDLDPKPDDRFGITAIDLPRDAWGDLPEILPFLGAGRVKLAMWSSQGDVCQTDRAGFDHLLAQLAEHHIALTGCLMDLPPGIARKLAGPGWAALLRARSEDWQPQLAFMISRHASHIDRWQLGADGSDLYLTEKLMRDVYARIQGEFARLVQKPDLAIPWPAWYELDRDAPSAVALSIHSFILPEQLPLYLSEIQSEPGRSLSLSLQFVDPDRYGRDVQIRDLAQRVIYALAAGAQRIDMPLPFSLARDEQDQPRIQPQESLIIIRTLMSTLGGSTFKGKVPIADGIEALLFDRHGQGILAMWDKGRQGGPRQLALALGESPRCVDLWGRVTPMPRGRTQSVQLTIGATPVLLVDVDGQLALLRASVSFDRPLIESSFQPHLRKIRFANPYTTALSGTVRLKGPAGWTFNPPVFAFSLNPGERFERDVSIEFPYNSFAGPKVIEAELKLPDNSITSTVVPIRMSLGLSDVGMQTLAIREGSDVLVQQLITNYGEKPVDYSAFAIYPNLARQERLVSNLSPGNSTIKLYRFNNVPQAAAKIRAGIKELEGTRILNDEVETQ